MAAEAADPVRDSLSKLTKNDPAVASVYESFLNEAAPRLGRERARKHAYESALGMVRSREAAAAIDELDATDGGTTRRDELLEEVTDPITGEYIGDRLKKDADPKKVAEILKTSRNAKRLTAAKKAENDLTKTGLTHVNDAIALYQRQLAAFDKDNVLATKAEPPEITEAREAMKKLIGQREALLQKLGVLPAPAKGAAPSGTKTEAAPRDRKSLFDEAAKAAFAK
jgi:hypothetical protein